MCQYRQLHIVVCKEYNLFATRLRPITVLLKATFPTPVISLLRQQSICVCRKFAKKKPNKTHAEYKKSKHGDQISCKGFGGRARCHWLPILNKEGVEISPHKNIHVKRVRLRTRPTLLHNINRDMGGLHACAM